MHLTLHLFIHFISSLVAGVIAWLFWGNALTALMAGFVGGFLIDLDHIIDYIVAFGLKIRISYFLNGYQFLKNDKIYVLFHGWEYVILSIIALFIAPISEEFKVVVGSLAIGSFFHLVVDRYINPGMSYKAYSLFFRVWKRFELQEIVTPEHYLKHQELKKKAEI